MLTKPLRPWYLLFFLIACGDYAGDSSSQPLRRQNLTQDEEIVVAVMGDYGVASAAEERVARLIHGWNPHFIVTTGDNNYPVGAEATLDDNIGRVYHSYILFGPLYRGRYQNKGAATQAFFPTLGNHDWHTDGASPYLRYFDLPGNKRYYRVSRGAVEFFMLDSDPREPDGTSPGSIQGQWLKSALQESTAVWKLIAFHHPPYSTGVHGSSVYMRWPFKTWGATAVLNGHDHHYERIVKGGLPYLVVGTGGAPLRPAGGRFPGAPVDVIYTRGHGALKINADGQQLTMGFYNTGGVLIDGFNMSHE